MSEQFFLGTMLPVLFLLAGLALLSLAWHHGRGTRIFLARARGASGRVIALKEVPATDPSSGEMKSYQAVIEFITDQGYRAQCRSLAHSYPAKYAVGDRVNILYDPVKPAEGRVRSFTDLWLLPLIFGGLGGMFTFLGTALLTGIIVP